MSGEAGIMRKLLVFVAQGLGVGRIPVAPGTFGSLLGVAWLALLLLTGTWWSLLLAALVLSLVAVPICGAAEKILNQRDPGSVVLDEIVAVPLCFVAWIIIYFGASKPLPAPAEFFQSGHLPFVAGVFLTFRTFDVWKPWPVRQSQKLPGGWGVVVDDLLAALYVNVITLGFWLIRQF